MEEQYTLQYRLYHTTENDGMYVFMANSAYQEGDLWLKINCTEPLSWIVYTEKLEEFIKLIGNSKTVCTLICSMIREKNRPKIRKLLEIHTPDEVKLMLDLLDEFVKVTVIKDYVTLSA